jgi:hypothetical protein
VRWRKWNAPARKAGTWGFDSPAHHKKRNLIMTAKEKQEQFLKEIKDVLKKYNAEISLEDFGYGYSQDFKIVIDFDFDDSLEDTGIVPQIKIGSFLDGC